MSTLLQEGITIEVGRRCQTGEGLFIFVSKQGPQIYRAIEEAIMHQSVQDLLSKATALPQDDPVKPPVRTPSPEPTKIAVSRRHLALPALPGTKPPVRILQPECGQAVYAKVKPLPKPRNISAPPTLLVPELVPEPEIETTAKDMDISDEEPDYESCDLYQKSQPMQDTDTQLYSTVNPLLRNRRKQNTDTNQEPPKSSRQSPAFNDAEVPVSFKQILSNVLFKDMSRVSPTPPTKYEESEDLLAEPDYYEIKK